MPPINTFSSFTHLNEVCFHLSYGHLHYTLNYRYQDVSTVLLHSLVFTSPFFFIFLTGNFMQNRWTLQCVADGNFSQYILRSSEGNPWARHHPQLTADLFVVG